MRQWAGMMTVAILLGASLPVSAEGQSGKMGGPTGQMERSGEMMGTESHLKAAGYDVMMARRAATAKDQKAAQRHLRSAQDHVRAAEGTIGAATDEGHRTLTNDVRRISQSLDRTSQTIERDLSAGSREMTRLDDDLRRVIQAHEGRHEGREEGRRP